MIADKADDNPEVNPDFPSSDGLDKRPNRLTQSQRDIALKYLDLARGEILEKTRFVNQTLGAYLLGSSALASWFYQTFYKPASATVATTVATAATTSATTVATTAAVAAADKATAAIGLALILAYLAFGVNWITYHNERIIAALARYQGEDLLPALGDPPPMWENSKRLKYADDRLRALVHVLVEELIVLGPPAVALIVASQQLHVATKAVHAWFFLALLFNVGGIVTFALMLRSKWELRSPDENTANPENNQGNRLQRLFDFVIAAFVKLKHSTHA